MHIYEEYESPAEKRRAQNASRPLKRMQPTGKARGYLMVFEEDGGWYSGRSYCYGSIGNVLNTEPGDGPHSLASANPSTDFLRHNCRIVGFEYLPKEWQLAFARQLKDIIEHSDYYRDNPKEAARYRRAIRIAERKEQRDAA